MRRRRGTAIDADGIDSSEVMYALLKLQPVHNERRFPDGNFVYIR